VVAVDPAVSAKKNSNETGIVVVGLGENDHGYVLADHSMIATPERWSAEVVSCFHRYDADKVIGEDNQGGDLVRMNIHALDAKIPYKAVHATRGKFKRAEPIGAQYERGFVHHVGHFPILEDQMTDFDPQIEESKQDSPDRMDALVWGFHELFYNRRLELKAYV
jgi:phage terminase large subunit-like protein